MIDLLDKRIDAVAHSIICIVFALLTRTTTYVDLAPTFDRRTTDDTDQLLVRKLERLGNRVTVEKVT